jgi:hypothetical protein
MTDPLHLLTPRPRRRVWPWATGAAAAVLLIGVGAAAAYGLGNHRAPTAAVAPSPTWSPMTFQDPTPSASAPPALAAHKLGESVTMGVLSIATVYAVKQPVATNATAPDQPGYVWGAADIKICAGTGDGGTMTGISITSEPWSLVYADGSSATPSSVGYQQFPKPEFPWGDHALLWGQCMRGWLVFPVPASQKAATVEYRPSQSYEGVPAVTTWTL